MIRMLVLLSGALALSAFTSTKQFADIGFKPPADSYGLIVLRPGVSVGLLTAGGLVELRNEWTNTARANILHSLETQQAGHGAVPKIATSREDAGGGPAATADLDRLHEAVGNCIKLHKYIAVKLPTKTGKFHWTLGLDIVAFGQRSGYDYALFLDVTDSFASSGRVALQAVAFMGCTVGVCIMSDGDQH